MLVDLTKCIGCGNCVRACQTENQVPDGYYRTWVERYHVSDWPFENPKVDSPDGGKNGFPPAGDSGGKNFFVPKLCNHCADSPCTQVCPVGATFVTPDGVVWIRPEVLPRLPLLRAGVPLRMPFHKPRKKNRGQVHSLLPPDHQGTHHRLRENCPTGARQLIDLKNPQDPIHEFLRTHTVQMLKPHLATGAKVLYHGPDGSVR